MNGQEWRNFVKLSPGDWAGLGYGKFAIAVAAQQSRKGSLLARTR
jgi:hypothetical protein